MGNDLSVHLLENTIFEEDLTFHRECFDHSSFYSAPIHRLELAKVDPMLMPIATGEKALVVV